jgi:periplasmic protein TonB
MYSPRLKARDKGGAIAAVIAIHAWLLFVFLHLSGPTALRGTQDAMRVFDLDSVPPPPPEPPQVQEVRQERQRPRDPEGAASPENIRSQATPIVAPEPIIQLPVQPPVAVTPTPNQGAAPTQGASDRPGPGTGAGGIGTGTGAGGAGSGGGGGGGIGTRPALLRGITSRDYPAQVQRRWPPGGSIFLRLRIEPDGRPSQCDVMRSFGDPLTDHWTCRLVMERGVFRPGTDERGAPVAAWFGYVQRDTGRFER